MNKMIPFSSVPMKRICLALVGVGFTTLLAGCGGSSSPAAPPSPTVTIDVFGARGTTLTAQVTSTNCSATPTVTWQTSGGVALGTGLSIQDTQPSSAISATATCSTATATENLQPLSVFNTLAAFAVLQNKTAEAWGNPVWGGQTATAESLTNISQLYPSDRGFAALLTDNTVQTWGSSYVSESNPNLVDPSMGSIATGPLTNIASIIPGRVAYFGIKKDGSFVAWGNYRGLITQVDTPMNDPTNGLSASTLASLTNVKSIAATEGAYAALKADGTVVTWGDPTVGGDSSSVASQLTNVVAITANKYAFAALKSNGTVVTWGMASKGGNSSTVAASLTNVRAIYATPFGAFLAVNKDGTFVNWGDQWAGGGTPPAKLTKIPYTS